MKSGPGSRGAFEKHEFGTWPEVRFPLADRLERLLLDSAP